MASIHYAFWCSSFHGFVLTEPHTHVCVSVGMWWSLVNTDNNPLPPLYGSLICRQWHRLCIRKLTNCCCDYFYRVGVMRIKIKIDQKNKTCFTFKYFKLILKGSEFPSLVGLHNLHCIVEVLPVQCKHLIQCIYPWWLFT